jgi:UDP-glucose 4-epimerase
MDGFANKKLLVVGGAGFVGSNLVLALLKHDPAEVLVVDNLLSAERANVPDDLRVRFIHASITEARVLAALPEDLDYAWHLATFHGNQNSIADPITDLHNNTAPAVYLFDRLKNLRRLKKVVYSAAGCTHAEKTFDKANPTKEDAPISLWLDSPYQISKISGEFYCNWYFKHHGLPTVKARFQNVYGPREILGAGEWRGTPATVWRNVTPTFVYRALKHMALPVENGGIASRDFIYAEDVARGLIACALQGEPGAAYNVASGVETTILELAEMVNRLAGNPTPIQGAPKRTWDRSGKRFGSTELSKTALGFAAEVGLEEGLKRTIAWTREQLPMIDACIARHAHHMSRLAA